MAKKKSKAAAKRPSTALQVRPKTPVVRVHDPKGLLPQSPVGQLGELATVGALGLAELKLTPAEEAVLSEPVNRSEIQWKPKRKDGPPEIPYLPHIVYTRWFSRAFGRTGWAIVPTARPLKQDNLIMVPYLLYVHGIPVAAATGEHEYYESNKQQTYGDVIESTVASALRRCAKRLGVGLEMWDKGFLSTLVPPRGGSARREEFMDAEPVRSEPATSSQTLTAPQRKRLTDICARMGRGAGEVTLWLKKRYGASSTKDIRQADYDAIIRALEARGALPMPGDDAA